jgi:hypothetical protein
LPPDFIGKVNVLAATAEGSGRFRVGGITLDVSRPDIAAGTSARIYLRPEDVTLHTSGTVPSMRRMR